MTFGWFNGVKEEIVVYVIIVGCGKVGSRFANVLADEGHDVVVIDNDSNKFKNLGEDFKGLTVVGIPIDKEVLKSAGIENADAFAAVTPDDNINIMACQMAKELFKVPRVLARIYNPEREHIFHHFGLETLCPTKITVESVKALIMDEQMPKTISLGNDSVNFREIEVEDKWEGKELNDIIVEDDEMIFGIVRDKHFIFNKLGLTINRNDKIVLSKKID
jgi:trk system potassium uptake protein